MKRAAFYSLPRLIKATGYSWSGLRAVFTTEAAFQLEVLLCILAAPVIMFMNITRIEKALLAESLALVLIAELINSAIETVVDRVSAEQHPLSKRAKDIGSAIVMLALGNAVIVWSFVLA